MSSTTDKPQMQDEPNLPFPKQHQDVARAGIEASTPGRASRRARYKPAGKLAQRWR